MLDLCCGKGGDLIKFCKSHVNILVGVDIASVSVSQAVDRYNNLREFRPNAYFYASDCAVADIRPLYEDLQLPKFDFVSCQFAFHYSFESEAKARRMMKNAAQDLRSGGHFALTTTDSCRLVKKARSIKSDTFGNDIFKVKFDNIDAINNPTEFGCKYFFSLEGAISDCPEYLVHPVVLKRIALDEGLELVWYERFHDFFQRTIQYPENYELFLRMRVLDEYTGTICPQQWEAIGYYCIYGFKKK